MSFRLFLALSLLSLGCGDDDSLADAGDVDSARVDSGSDDGGGDDSGGDADDDAAGDDSGAADTGDDDPATAFCRVSIERAERCGDIPPTLEACVTVQACTLNVLFRADAAPAVGACIDALDCDASDDPCYSASGLGLAPSAGADDYSTACNMKREECGGAFSDDYCFFDLAADGIYAMIEACFDEDCDAVEDCLGVVLSCGE